MKDSVLSLSQQLRNGAQQRWLSAIAASRCVTAELSSAQILSVDLTPHGFAVEFLYDSEFDDSWLPLIERHVEDLPDIKQMHCMMAANAAQWIRSQGRVRESEPLVAKGKQEVNILEWQDGRVDWLPFPTDNLSFDSEGWTLWSLTSSTQSPDEETRGKWRILLEGVAAPSMDRLRKLQKANKKFNSILDQLPSAYGVVMGASAERLHGLWQDWNGEKIPLALPTPGISRLEGIEELAETWARHAPGSRASSAVLGAIGCWDGEAGDVWGDLRWEANDVASLEVMTDWLHSVQQRLKLLGFECEIVAHYHAVSPAKAGEVAYREAAQWLKRWAKNLGLEVVPSVGYDTVHGSEPWGGPSLEWRVFDPLGASWSFARLGVGVDARADWVKQWRRNFNRRAQRDAALAEQRAARLQDGRWLIASSCVDVEQEARLSQIWQSWKAKSGGNK